MNTNQLIGYALCVLACALTANANADVEEYDVAKIRVYEQVSQSPPSVPVEFAFNSYLDVLKGEATSVTLNGAPFVEIDFGAWDFENQFASQSELDAAFPSGSAYTIDISGGTLGSLSETVMLPMPEVYPAAPAITPASFDSIQDADPNVDLLIEWVAPDVNTNFIALSIYDTFADDYLVDDDIDVSQTSFTLLADDLQPDRTYEIELVYANVEIGSGNPFPGFGKQAFKLTGYAAVTIAEFTTGTGITEIEDDAGILKAAQHRQTADNTPPGPAESWSFEAYFDAGAGAMGFGEVVGGAAPLQLLEYSPGEWDADDGDVFFTSKSIFDASFPSDTIYSMDIGGGFLGMRSQPFSIGPDGYPAPGFLTGSVLSDLQGMDSQQDVIISWSTPSPDVNVVGIFIDRVDSFTAFETVLTSTAMTQITIPAGVLEPGADYELGLTFANVDLEAADPDPGFGNEYNIVSGFLTDTLVAFSTDGGCIADLTGDGQLDFFDVSAFLVAFQSQDPLADFTGDGMFDFFDVSSFLIAFQGGCP